VSGAPSGAASVFRRLLARAIADDPAAFVVPDLRIAHASGLDPVAAGLRIVSNPRHASILLLIGELPPGLIAGAQVVYAQMPNPRLILAVATELPAMGLAVDIVAGAGQAGLVEGVQRSRDLLVRRSGSTASEPVTLRAAVREPSPSEAAGHGAMSQDHTNHVQDMDGPTGSQPTAEPERSHDEQGLIPSMRQRAALAPPVSSDQSMDSPWNPPVGSGCKIRPGKTDHGAMGHEAQSAVDHAVMDDEAMPTHPATMPGVDHAAMNHDAEPDADKTDSGRAMSHGGQMMNQSDHMMSADDQTMDHSGHMMTHGGQMLSDGDRPMDHSDHMMDHRAGGFMSMIAMTQDLPRSRDGLPMEWVETSFGPLFPGLPAGLGLTLTLDGDTVAVAAIELGITHRGLAWSLPCPIAAFPDLLARLDPLAPASYRVLASRALEAIADLSDARPMDRGWLGAIEWERAVNHLGWLAAFGEPLGMAWLAERAGALQIALKPDADVGSLIRLRTEIERFLRTVNRIPLLSRRLAGIGWIDELTAATTRGPVARGAGILSDSRSGDPTYSALGFTPVLRDGGDARARLDVRLAEISQSLALVAGAGSREMRPPNLPPGLAGAGMAVIETPRGTASLHVAVANGQVRTMRLDTPSAANLSLVPRLAEGAELGDALVAIASLDLSPWEVDQ